MSTYQGSGDEIIYAATCPQGHKRNHYVTARAMDKFFLLCPHCGGKMVLGRVNTNTSTKRQPNDDS